MSTTRTKSSAPPSLPPNELLATVVRMHLTWVSGFRVSPFAVGSLQIATRQLQLSLSLRRVFLKASHECDFFPTRYSLAGKSASSSPTFPCGRLDWEE